MVKSEAEFLAMQFVCLLLLLHVLDPILFSKGFLENQKKDLVIDY